MRNEHRGIGMTSQRTRERMIRRLREAGIRNTRVLDVIRHTPRHLFVDEALAHRAYEDTALPIGHGQTISQPYMVARMTEIVLENDDPGKVLEIGTGSGYQAAVLAPLVPQVFSIERIMALHQLARQRYQTMGLHMIRVKCADGSLGWPEHAPFGTILLTAATEDIPQQLLHQLAIGGRLLAPLEQNGAQHLAIITRTAENYAREVREAVSFVPLRRGRA